jgi:hypothetical protein
MVLIAYMWSSVLWLAIPEEEVGGINWKWLIVFVPLACALGMNRVTIIDFMNMNFCFCSIAVMFSLSRGLDSWQYWKRRRHNSLGSIWGICNTSASLVPG